MTANDLIAAFETLADAPDGVKRLRELVLQLAVRGKLVAQDPQDEPARATTTELRRLRSSRRERATKDDGETRELGFELPRGWATLPLAEMCSKIGAGSTPLGGAKVYVDDGVMFLRSQNVWNDGLRLHDVARILPDVHQRMAGTHVQPGDLLFNITGASIGRCGRVPSTFEPANVSQHVTIVRPYLATTQPFLHLVLISDVVQRRVVAEEVGVSREGLSIAKLGRFPVPLPPLAEQHRIVARVDELMGLLDRLEAARTARDDVRRAARDAALAALRDAEDTDAVEAAWGRIAGRMDALFAEPEDVGPLRQAVLGLAVRGRLVPQDSRDESANAFLRRVVAERTRVGGRASKGGAVASHEVPFEVPQTWTWVRFGDIFECRLGKMLDKAKNRGNLHPYLRNANVRWGSFDLSDVLQMRLEEHEVPDVTVRRGDLVICEGGEPGRASVWESEEPLVIQKALHRARPYLVDGRYYQIHLRVDCASGRVAKLFTGATIQHFTGQVLDKHTVTLPPLPEQHRIVAKVDALMAICDALEARLTTARDLHGQFAAAAVHDLAR